MMFWFVACLPTGATVSPVLTCCRRHQGRETGTGNRRRGGISLRSGYGQVCLHHGSSPLLFLPEGWGHKVLNNLIHQLLAQGCSWDIDFYHFWPAVTQTEWPEGARERLQVKPCRGVGSQAGVCDRLHLYLLLWRESINAGR